MAKVKKDTIPKTVALAPAEWEAIESYRQSERLVTTAEAVRRLLRWALHSHAQGRRA